MNLETCRPLCLHRDEHLSMACRMKPVPLPGTATVSELHRVRAMCGNVYAARSTPPASDILIPTWIDIDYWELSGTVEPGLTSIIIPVRGAHAALLRCLTALAANTQGEYEVVIVIDDEEYKENIFHEAFDGPAFASLRDRIGMCRTKEPLGFPAACNAGVFASRGEFIVLLNSDAYVTTGWLPPLLGAIANTPVGAAGPVGPNVFGVQGNQQSPAREIVAAAAREGWAGVADVLTVTTASWLRWHESKPSEAFQTKRLVGYCLAIRRSLWNMVGGLYEGYGLGNFDDDDLCLRLRLLERTLLVVPESLVLHEGSQSFGALWGEQAEQQYDKLLGENRVKFGARWAWVNDYYQRRMEAKR